MELQGGIAPLPPDAAEPELDHEHSSNVRASGWGAEVQTELGKPYPDRQVLKSLCAGRLITPELRPQLWVCLLGVQRKPNVMGDWEATEDLKTSALLRAECAVQAGKLELGDEERDELADKMAVILSYYCSVRSVEYRPGWAEVLRPLICMGLPKGEVYNCFYAMLDKYIPYSGAQANKLPYRVFRLLLQYHDPQLSHFLDTMRVDPHLYVYNWFRSLFVNSVANDVALALWDAYLLEGDAYLVFYMSLVLLINSRDAILDTKSSEELSELLPTLPDPLTATDAEDFVSCALHYGITTPHSVRQKDLMSHLFSTNIPRDGKLPSAVTSVMDDLCLSVSAAEICQQAQLTRQAASRLKYLVIDTRPADQFFSGRLATAFHLDPNTMMESPDEFYEVVKSLKQMAEDHLCFYGTGAENDTHLRTIISHFLQQNFKNISYVRGGYEALHVLLKKNNLSELADHLPDKCHVCAPPLSPPQDLEVPQPALEKEQLKSRFMFGMGGRVTSETATAYLAKKLSALKSSESTPEPPATTEQDKAENGANVGLLEPSHSEHTPGEGLPQSNSWSTGISSLVKKSGEMLEKSKDAWDKFQSVTAPMESQPSEAGPAQASSRDKAPPVTRRISKERNVFGIGGSDDEDAVSSEGEGEQQAGRQEPQPRPVSASKQVSEDLSAMTRVVLGEWASDRGALHEFPCNEILPQGAWMPSCIVVTTKDFSILRTPMDRYPEAYLKETRSLRTLNKITAKKKHPNLITFVFQEGGGEAVQRRFMLPNGRACSQEVGKLVLESVKQK